MNSEKYKVPLEKKCSDILEAHRQDLYWSD